MSGPYPSLVTDVTDNQFFIRPPPPFPYPAPHVDDKLLLQAFPKSWLYDGEIAYGRIATRTLTNIDLIDATTHFVDDADRTKKFRFQADQITTGTTREITVPDEDFTMITPSSSVTLTNKTIVGNTNTVGATQLETSGLPVIITSSAPTAVGQALVATSPTTATWQTVGGGGGSTGNIAYPLINIRQFVPNIAYATASRFSWIHSRYAFYTFGIVIFHATVSTRTLDIKLRNTTTSTDLGSLLGIAVSGIYSFTITLPTANADLEIQVKKNVAGGANPTIEYLTLEFTQ
jgi:hypothetical protein